MKDLLDLASERLGGSVLYANDDYFAEKENLLKPSKPVWKEHEYTDRGKWMDGWESRRKRVPGHDFAIIRLGLRGVVRGVVVDTAFFRGNYPESCSIDGTAMRVDAPVEQLLDAEWREILPRSPLQGDSENPFEVSFNDAVTHLRFNIFPDGGVSRMRVWGVATAAGRRAAVVRRVNTLFHPRELLQVCASKEWAMRMYVARPFPDWESLVYVARQVWERLDDEHRLEAFAGHPRIGERKAGWSSQEQSGTRGASEETMRAIAEGNRAYEEKFGFIYLVCATGRSANEMLANLNERLTHDRRTELDIAAAEQAKIIELRLEKLVM